MSTCSGSYGNYCCVPWCQNNGRTQKKPGTCFFRIPQDSRSTAWVTYSRRADLVEKPVSLLYTSYRICSDHFTAQDFMNPGRTRLRKTAVPTVPRYPGMQCDYSADVPPVGAFADTSPQYIVPEDRPEESTYISCFMSEDPAVRGYGHPVSEEQAGKDVLEETAEKGSLMTESHVAEGSLQGMSGCNSPVRELGAAGCQVDVSGSDSTGAEHCAVHDAVSKMFASTSSCIRTAASSEGDFPAACNGAARKFPSKKFRKTYRFQSKVATYRRTITRLWKQQHKLPLSTSKTLSLIHSRVTKEVFKLLCAHMHLQQKDKAQLSGAHSCDECRRHNSANKCSES
ncbi:uncharacterized protein [Dermacentor andersoni]|uniref:uncharacterized protein isoform X8 n=1 Tax=Dermacentor andersoni TaxID=34620 RepID=UPI002416AE62|nr:uncharacterized protein LOC126533145 isoform X8 [Dermacentor andersoni]